LSRMPGKWTDGERRQSRGEKSVGGGGVRRKRKEGFMLRYNASIPAGV
jgi:hypothetical protein